MVPSLKSRRGSVVTEATVVLPLLFLLVFACLEYSWAYSRKIEVSTAARIAARTAALAHSTLADVETATANQMASAGFGAGDWVLELEPSDPAAAEPGTPIFALIRADYDAVSLGGAGSLFPLPEEVTAAAAMRKEGNP